MPSKDKWLRAKVPDYILHGILGSLCQIVYRRKNGTDEPVGTAFVICGSEKGILCATATHVFTQIASWENDHLASMAGRKRSDLSSAIAEKRIGIVLTDTKSHIIAPVITAYGSVECDILYFFVEYEPEKRLPPILKKIAINTDLPEEGQEVIAVAFHRSKSEKSRTQRTYSHTLDLRKGSVSKVFRKGHNLIKGPCFQTSIPFAPGMSGGAILMYPSDDTPLAACGVISCDISEPDSQSDGSPGLSFAALFWPTLALGFKTNIDGVDQGWMSLMDYIELGRITDIGKERDKITIRRVKENVFRVDRKD